MIPCRTGIEELMPNCNYEVAEFIPNVKTRLLRLRLAMTARDPDRDDNVLDFLAEIDKSSLSLSIQGPLRETALLFCLSVFLFTAPLRETALDLL